MPSGQSRVYRVTQLRTDSVHCRESVGTGPIVLKVVPVTGAAILQVTVDQFICASLFPHPLLVWNGHVDKRQTVKYCLVVRKYPRSNQDRNHEQGFMYHRDLKAGANIEANQGRW